MNTKEPFCFWNLISSYWWKTLGIKLLGGRPMIFIEWRFTDIVSNKAVNKYQDRLGRYWLAESNYSMFRVKL